MSRSHARRIAWLRRRLYSISANENGNCKFVLLYVVVLESTFYKGKHYYVYTLGACNEDGCFEDCLNQVKI